MRAAVVRAIEALVLQVTANAPKHFELRSDPTVEREMFLVRSALVTAKDADDIWTVRVEVREGMLRWLGEEHPYALPRVKTADAVLPPGRRDHRSAGGVPAARRVHTHPRER